MAKSSIGKESPNWELQKTVGSPKTFVYTRRRGYDIIRNPHLNKGMAFTLEERLQLGIHGLLPPCVLGQDVQLLRVLKNYEMRKDDLDRYIFLMALQDRNEKLFYRALTSDIERFMPIVYTPTVGLACQQYGLAFRRPRGLFVTIHDRGHVATLLKSWPENDILAIVVTDGERILGLGDLGSYGMGIPVGKLALYTACSGVNPQQCLPVMLDVGTDNEELLKDPLYIGLRHKRVRGQAYDDLVEEFMQAVTERYGQNILIQFEDFANANAFRLLNKYRDKYCTFNDDIQGTAAVAVAGLLAALRITKNKLSDHKFLFQGAGEAAMGIANLIVMAMEKEETPRQQAVSKIWMVDSKGLIVQGRANLTHQKLQFAHPHPELRNLDDAVRDLKPTAIIGVAAISGAFTEQIIKDMASFNKHPIIFALSNPTSKAECTAEQCYRLTEAIAEQVLEEHLAEGRLYPPLDTIRTVSLTLAVKIAEYVFRNGMASVYPEPKDKESFISSLIYSTDYDEFVIDSYTWPEEASKIQTVKK
ncbi:NADP-dependent malic enzyme isoform X3 [Heptranchias perlo]|uniref:NADP-dependent malic enzyme isoform X3 n=1 Tax=Heptranchias perlo TaxID=212740 RepID=UPI003559E77D